MTHLSQKQHQRHDASVETTDHKVYLLEKSNHSGERPAGQPYTDTFADKHLGSSRKSLLIVDQLKEQ